MSSRKADDQKRRALKKGSKVEIYSNSRKKWTIGTISRIYRDRQGEWLEVKYGAFPHNFKDMKRYDRDYLRPMSKKKVSPSTQSLNPSFQ